MTRRTKTPRKAAHGARQHADGPNHCDAGCKRPTKTQAHCAARGCHRTFGGVGNFDRHRRDGRCLPPETLGMSLVAEIWRVPMTDAVRQSFSRVS